MPNLGWPAASSFCEKRRSAGKLDPRQAHAVAHVQPREVPESTCSRGARTLNSAPVCAAGPAAWRCASRCGRTHTPVRRVSKCPERDRGRSAVGGSSLPKRGAREGTEAHPLQLGGQLCNLGLETLDFGHCGGRGRVGRRRKGGWRSGATAVLGTACFLRVLCPGRRWRQGAIRGPSVRPPFCRVPTRTKEPAVVARAGEARSPATAGSAVIRADTAALGTGASAVYVAKARRLARPECANDAGWRVSRPTAAAAD
jgi:hypothetical protein